MPGKKNASAPAVPLQPMPGSTEEVVLAVIDRANDETILLHLITSDYVYRKQEDTFISWCDPEAGMRLSLSFQDPAGCSHIWETICKLQTKQRRGLRDGSNTDAPHE